MSKVSRREFIKFGAVSALAASGIYASDMPVFRDKEAKFDEEWDGCGYRQWLCGSCSWYQGK